MDIVTFILWPFTSIWRFAARTYSGGKWPVKIGVVVLFVPAVLAAIRLYVWFWVLLVSLVTSIGDAIFAAH
jgi:hypothetical protein